MPVNILKQRRFEHISARWGRHYGSTHKIKIEGVRVRKKIGPLFVDKFVIWYNNNRYQNILVFLYLYSRKLKIWLKKH